MAELTRIRMEQAELDPAKKGGRPRTRFSKAEAEERALERMLPKALQVLEQQLDSPDLRVQQAAAVKVIEYVKGKPVQQINANVAQVAEIRYVSAAWDPTAALGGGHPVVEAIEMSEDDLLELPPAPED